ncbi:MAG: serine protease [Erysipelotrichaceae bacterium]|nr:serine protease [Erysipelotrichaceae bacterium]
MKLQRLLLVLVAILFVWVLVLTSQLGKEPAASEETVINNVVSGFSTDLTKVAEERAPAIATVESGSSLSTAVFYRSAGGKSYFLTTYHALSPEAISLRLENGYTAEAAVKGFDVYSDVCLLETEIPYELSEVPFGNAELLQKGEFLLTFGAPRIAEYSPSVALAMVSSRKTTVNNLLNYQDGDYSYYLDLIQISSNLTGGYSGGPVFNMNGELVGMNCFSLRSSDGVSFALPVNEISFIAEKLLNGENVDKTMFGIRGKPVRDMRNYEKAAMAIELTQLEGYYIENLHADSLGIHAGLQPGDILLSVNGEKIVSETDLLKAQYEDTGTYDLLVSRNGEQTELHLSIEKESEVPE